MKIEAGKFYTTRDKRKAFVAGCTPFQTESEYIWVGFIDGYGSATWIESGGYRHDGDSDYDLMSPWEEPKPFATVLDIDGKKYELREV